ncbi:MAG: antitoxin family protein [Anaerolineae bacterium]|nr:antitoxin family protein [Anaerolineae bacterium]
MVVSVRAVYKAGQLRLLEPVDLAEGQVVDVTIQSETQPTALTPQQVDARLRAANLRMDVSGIEDAEELSPEERHRIGKLFVGERPSEDLIDDDRGLSR